MQYHDFASMIKGAGIMYVSKVSPRGQIVIPKYFRDRLAIKSYSRVVFSEDEGRLVITVLPADPIAGARGILKKGLAPLPGLIKKNREEEIAHEKKHHRK
ncbi:MAG: AbrB/MazE/SpoVT family DNA-binding domain-containing protein [Peptococcaceae bacterium]|nr:MAG: AbrB/MazE/SpoVT family DNA-binding domain-containing protein [Peptococcaceae bacterium]